MEFHLKLQELRKSKGLTQEDLANSLYVSRTAISKWESGRGYPSIDSLKAISKFFSISIDDLLSGEEVLEIAEEDHKQKSQKQYTFIFALLDCSSAAFFLIPLFRQTTVHGIFALPLLEINSKLNVLYYTIVGITIIYGILSFALQCNKYILKMQRASLLLSVAATLIFTACTQPYAAAFSLLFLLIKGFLHIKSK